MIYRIDVSPVGPDRAGESVRQQIAELGAGDVGSVQTSRIYLIDTDATRGDVERIAFDLLADPIVERAQLIDDHTNDAGSRIEVHLKPGVMDPVATSTEMALRDAGLATSQVRTGRAFVMKNTLDRGQLKQIASRILANGVIESIHFTPFVPTEFEHAHEQPFNLRHVPLIKLSDAELTRLSREGHLFLSLIEMQAIQKYCRSLEREPTDIELETIAQTWSEHCVHKTLKSAVEVKDDSGKTLRSYKNLIKETIFHSTMELMKRRNDDFCLSVFKDNAGVIAFDDADAVCFKVETHNHPSAIEPY